MAIIIYCGVYTGALVRHADASLAYGGWPLPFTILEPHSEQDWVQLTHRIMAFIVFTIIMITYIHAVKNYPNKSVYFHYPCYYFILLHAVITGALSIMTNVNLYLSTFPCIIYHLFIWYDNILYHMLVLRSVRSDKQ